jgi:hypothetical protein
LDGKNNYVDPSSPIHLVTIINCISAFTVIKSKLAAGVNRLRFIQGAPLIFLWTIGQIALCCSYYYSGILFYYVIQKAGTLQLTDRASLYGYELCVVLNNLTGKQVGQSEKLTKAIGFLLHRFRQLKTISYIDPDRS